MAKSRKRYLPGPELSNDPEWNNGELPRGDFTALGWYCEGYGLDIRAMRSSESKLLERCGKMENHENAFEECVALIEEDPGNRLATSELVKLPTREERKIPYIKAALTADPLNFRAREYLFRQEEAITDSCRA